MFRWTAVIALTVGVVACESPTIGSHPLEPDRACFDEEIYPILIADCGYPACHGNPERPFRVFAEGRTRLSPPPAGVELAEAERTATYNRTRSMLADAPRPDRSLLLRKPLETSAGGAAHGGLDAFGRDVYLDPTVTHYQELVAWVRGESRSCGVAMPDGGT